VYDRHHRFGQVDDRGHDAIGRREHVFGAADDVGAVLADVGAGAEPAARPAEADHAHVGVGRGPCQGALDGREHGLVECVETVGAVERQRQHAVVERHREVVDALVVDLGCHVLGLGSGEPWARDGSTWLYK
jgi:hypothetical protein